jgi:hypothetical protein
MVRPCYFVETRNKEFIREVCQLGVEGKLNYFANQIGGAPFHVNTITIYLDDEEGDKFATDLLERYGIFEEEITYPYEP